MKPKISEETWSYRVSRENEEIALDISKALTLIERSV